MKLDPRTKDLARQLRRELSPAEKILWRHLRGKRFMRFKFRRQHPVEPYVADFACVNLGLVNEVDGESHLGKEAKDGERTAWLEKKGWCVLRFWNTEVFDETEAVLERIWQVCQEITAIPAKPSSPLSPLGRGAGGEGDS